MIGKYLKFLASMSLLRFLVLSSTFHLNNLHFGQFSKYCLSFLNRQQSFTRAWIFSYFRSKTFKNILTLYMDAITISTLSSGSLSCRSSKSLLKHLFNHPFLSSFQFIECNNSWKVCKILQPRYKMDSASSSWAAKVAFIPSSEGSK